MQLYRVTDYHDNFLMIAPLSTLVEVYPIDANGLLRLEIETAEKDGTGVCTLHFNGCHPRLAGIQVYRETGASAKT